MKLRRWTLGQQVNLSELKRVVHLLSLYLVRIRSFLVSLIPWSEARSHPPSPQNTSQRQLLFSDVLQKDVSELNS